jgi:hypothetical protein
MSGDIGRIVSKMTQVQYQMPIAALEKPEESTTTRIALYARTLLVRSAARGLESRISCGCAGFMPRSRAGHPSQIFKKRWTDRALIRRGGIGATRSC